VRSDASGATRSPGHEGATQGLRSAEAYASCVVSGHRRAIRKALHELTPQALCSDMPTGVQLAVVNPRLALGHDVLWCTLHRRRRLRPMACWQ
jgi:hypothetical protein